MKKNTLTTFLLIIACSLFGQKTDIFKIENGYQIEYNSEWAFFGNPSSFGVKLKKASSELNFRILPKTMYPLGCENAKLTCIDYSNGYYSKVKDVSMNNWVGYETDDFTQKKETDLVNKRILIEFGDKGFYEIHISGRKKSILENNDKIVKLLSTIKLFPPVINSIIRELTVNSDSLKNSNYNQSINQQIIDELQKCNSIKIDKDTINSLAEYFEWRVINKDVNKELKRPDRILQFFDFSNFESLEIKEESKKIKIIFYLANKEVCLLSFDILGATNLPLGKRINLNTFFLDKSGKMYFDKKNNQLIDSQPILFLNGDAYPLSIKRKSLKII